MSMNTWSPLWSQVVDSTLWEEPLPVRVLFLTMLAIKEPDHVVRMPFRRLCKKANMDPAVCQAALNKLIEPDKLTTDEQPFEGRRIKQERDGWLVLNGEHYQREVQRLVLRMKKTQWQRDKRAKDREEELAKLEQLKPVKRGRPLKGERQYLKAVERGDEVEADRIAAGEVKAAVQEVSVPEPVSAAASDLPCPEVSPGGVSGGGQVERVLADNGSDTDTEEISLEVPGEE